MRRGDLRDGLRAKKEEHVVTFFGVFTQTTRGRTNLVDEKEIVSPIHLFVQPTLNTLRLLSSGRGDIKIKNLRFLEGTVGQSDVQLFRGR